MDNFGYIIVNPYYSIVFGIEHRILRSRIGRSTETDPDDSFKPDRDTD